MDGRAKLMCSKYPSEIYIYFGAPWKRKESKLISPACGSNLTTELLAGLLADLHVVTKFLSGSSFASMITALCGLASTTRVGRPQPEATDAQG